MGVIFRTGGNGLLTRPNLIISGSPVIDSSLYDKGSGPVCIKCDAGSAPATLKYDWTGTPTIRVGQFRIFVPSSVPSGLDFRVANVAGSSYHCIFNFLSSTNTLRCRQTDGISNVDQSTTITRDVWHLVDLRVNVSANPWTVDWRVDKTAQTQNSFTHAATDLDFFIIGSMDSASGVLTYFDDWVIADASGDYPLNDEHVTLETESFPSTPILDNFNRANESPVNGWTDVEGGMRIVSNQLTGNAVGGIFDCARYDGFNVSSPRSYECYLTFVTTITATSVPQFHYMSIFKSGIGFNGYNIIPNIPDINSFRIRRDDDGGNVTKIDVDTTGFGGSMSDGDSCGVRVIGSTHYVYYKPSGSEIYVPCGSFVDGVYKDGYLIPQCDGTGTNVFDDLGGGQNLIPEKQTSYYPRPRIARR